MEEDTEYVKLPVEDRCAHKLWKARVHGYEECAKSFRCIDDEKSPEFNKFVGLVKKFVIDNNAAAQEKGLEAVLAFVENAAVAGKSASDVINGIVSKCIAAPKTKTKELAVQVTLMYIEIEKQEAVQEELMKGTEAKNPKIVAACISTLTLALREFGPKVLNVKPLIKKLPAFLEDRDKAVREEGKVLAIELYKWIGAPLKQQLNTLKPVQLTELEAEFQKLGEKKVTPTRYLKSQKPKETLIIDTEIVNGDEEDKEDDESEAPDVDPYDLLDPVDILSKIPKDFFEKVESKKWQERKEGLEILQNLVGNPKLENGDYGDIVRILKKLIAKDSNVMIVALAAKCLTGLANGLKKQFTPYALPCLSTVLEKFREKKQNVVTALRESSDAIFQSVNIEVILDDVIAALENKNPAVKAETAAFLARCFVRTPPANLSKKLLKAYTMSLLKTLNEPVPFVRDNSAEAIGTAMKLIGEKSIMPFLPDLDNLKMVKIRECAEKAVILVKIQNIKKSQRPSTAPSKTELSSREKEATRSKRPNSIIVGKRPATKKSSESSGNGALKKSQSKSSQQAERNLSPEEVEEIACDILSKDVVSGLVDSNNWKNRLTAVEQLFEIVKTTDPEQISTQVIVRTLAKKPGFKDNNFQVLKIRMEIIKYLAENCSFTSTSNEYCLLDIIEKLGDVKNSSIAGETLTAIAEATSFDQIANEVMSFSFNQKNPKVQQESLVWLTRAMTEFGCPSNPNIIIDNVKKAVAATNLAVRTSALNFIGIMYLFMGKDLISYFDGEKPALKQLIEHECEKRNGDSPPVPIRGLKNKKKAKVQESLDDEVEEKSNGNQESDNVPRVDINSQITECLFSELSDKNWKVRNEGLQKITAVLTDAKFIKPTIGDLPQWLAPRLLDSNSKIAQTTLGVCELLATAMGPPIKQHIRTLFPGFIQCLGDSKNWIRAAAVSCINTWTDQCGYKEFFEGEMIGDALKSGSPALRSELWIWLSQVLPLIPVKSIPKEELMICLSILYGNLEDRNSDVRKNAQDAILGFMIHLSYELMARNTEKLKPGSKTVVLGLLDKARSNLPMKPLPSKKPATEENGVKSVKSGGAAKAAKATVKPRGSSASKPASARKKDEEVDSSPLLAVNNLKHQRVIDEQKLKVLKWNFTTPREEFVDLLKELMAAANVNKSLTANMFHSDFRYHLKAIEALTEDLPGNSKALVSNLDLILKWLTLRFFDTNPSVLLKGLEYLQAVFNILIEDGYHMQENEAASFIPYLIIKIGDPKDTVRNGVRALFKQIALVYPVSKLFMYTMEGLKSKNARQRTECLDQLGSLIENYGVTVCQPSPSTALKEVAKQIADRDNSVRNAALNCIVQAYFLEGEKVFKLIGQISEKDQSLLDERIKRAAKNRPVKSASTTQIAPAKDKDPVPSIPVVEPVEDEYEEEVEEEQENQIPNEKIFNHSPQMEIKSAKVSGPFGLDMELLQRIESCAPVKCRNPKLLEPSLDDFSDPIHNINLPPNQIIPISPPKLLDPKSSGNVQNFSRSRDDDLDRKIEAMASLDPSVAIQAMNNMGSFLKSHQFLALQQKEDKFISAVNLQLKLLQTYSLNSDRHADISKAFRTCFMVILSFYESGGLGMNVPINHLKELVHQMISLLAENKLNQLNEAEAYNRVINNIVIKIIDSSNHTTIICVLIKLLHECTDTNALPKYEELIMKCLWKVVKTIPNWANELNYDVILLEVHNFFKDYPSAWWKKRESDTPLRTIKTILHSITRIKGSSILNHLSQVNNTNESELHSYLLRLITTLKPDEANAASRNSGKSSNQTKSQKHLGKYTHQQLSEIFKKIGSKTQTQEGLTQLYDFKLQHPEADVQPFLVKSHQFFQDFIEQGLKNIDQARKSQGHVVSQNNKHYISGNTQVPEAISESKSHLDPLDRLQKLRNLEAQCQKNTSSPSSN